VPLLVLWIGFEEREAAGTSLAAIALIAVLAAAAHAAYGNVDLSKGILIGLPALAGVVGGTAIQQRISPRTISAVFAVFLVASAAVLVI
jgi:uncharacterized membrane protein YfcA